MEASLFLFQSNLDLGIFACMISRFRFSRVSLVYRSSFKGDQMSFVKVLLLQVLDLCSFNFVTLNKDGVGDAQSSHALLKGKVIAIDGNFGVRLLLKTDWVISR